MIVLGADTHKRSHTVAAVAAATGELLGEQTVAVGPCGFGALLHWARGLDDQRVWALEDCRHVSGSLERFLIERGERVLRVPTHLTANARRSARQRGKSDPIDALNVARAALREGLEEARAYLDLPENVRWLIIPDGAIVQRLQLEGASYVFQVELDSGATVTVVRLPVDTGLAFEAADEEETRIVLSELGARAN
jgi:transposase